MKIRVDKLDVLFSQYIKLRDKVCQVCGRATSLQTAHFIGRRYRSTRYDPDNACLLCFADHQHFHENPLEFVEFFKARLGEEGFDFLRGRARSTWPKVDKKLIEVYLKEEIKKLTEI